MLPAPATLFAAQGDEQRIEATATLRLKTRARIETLILDLFPKFTIAEIAIDGQRIPASAYANPEGQLIGYSDNYPKTPFGWDWLLNHEFSHEWFANQLSVANYDDLWLHEGLGSFYRAALPKVIATREHGLLKLRWQTPDDLPFPMPLDVRVDGTIVTLPMTGGRGETPAGDRAAVTIDPRSKILMQSDAIDKYQEWNAARR